MCGIHVAISAAGKRTISPALERRLRNRGPDHTGTVTTRVGDTTLTFTSTVLSLRGDHVVKQPLIDVETGSVLCWNGEAWTLRGNSILGNDGQAILSSLSKASRHGLADRDGDDDDNFNDTGVLDVLREIKGPFAFVFLDRPAKRLYYGRDRLGRRSMLVSPGQPFLLSSVADYTLSDWVEVEPDGIYMVQLQEIDMAPKQPVPVRYGWAEDESLISGIGTFNSEIPAKSSPLTNHSDVVRQLRQVLTQSLRLRVLQVPLPPGASHADARIAVLFSGGLDCTVLARLASEVAPGDQAIDLVNVAFENPRIAAQNKGSSQDELFELCPDRITGRRSFAELVHTCPERKFRLVVVNVPFSLACQHRSEVIDLIYPHNTEMDLSIAYALYFAARGDGWCQVDADSQPEAYRTTARVLLSGLGADELFGGYSRHASAFERDGYGGLIEELKLDVSRLGKRNLGRDDRVMAHWEKEVRFPYLDEELVRWGIHVPVWEKCDFGKPPDDGDTPEAGKRILRLLAQQLGMGSVALEKKRAIQFGARTAKMESGKVKGTSVISPAAGPQQRE
ncbi:uncharacterized protein UV8b_02983 [Ustilaginoidea virens]|uniref:Glutamine amidotransferase type-2 domain-containing protein n=1 Tax=Ustilaginoidea virens TaxID=1159556 RepID=A0A8E5MGN8_USTVR|nr:uncharacterized protein UV8b_02983 [Ustilaginoidea virens]QUC18742.1 hypothetical protein UV8b_02983 [Ustilaginoidea virens]